MAAGEERPGEQATPGERYRHRHRGDPGGGAYAAPRDDAAARRRVERFRRAEERRQDGERRPPGSKKRRPPGWRWYDGWGDGAEWGCCLLDLLWTTAAVVAVGAVGLAVRRGRGRRWGRASAGGRTGGTAARRRGSS